MHLHHTVDGPENIDPSRPLILGRLTLGVEAAAEAVSILADPTRVEAAIYVSKGFDQPFYWSVEHANGDRAEVFGFPLGWTDGLPTALEVALVKTCASLEAEHHETILNGGVEVVLGSLAACEDFKRAAYAAQRPLAGASNEFGNSGSVVVRPRAGTGTKVALGCLVNSYTTSPIKFRYLEVYRVLESLFLADVKAKLMNDFDGSPSDALTEATKALESELAQIIVLGEPHQELFQECWSVLNDLKGSNNRFAAALFKTVKKKKHDTGGQWRTGAALVYQTRCAIVHAGAKDIIYENFSDANDAIDALLPVVERLSLRLLGINIG